MNLEKQLCINNMTYRRYSFSYFLDSVKRLGVSQIELSGCHPHFTEYEYERFPVRKLAKEIKTAGIQVAAIEPEQNFLPVNIASHQKYLREKSIEQMRFYIRNAGEFDCKYVIIYPGKGTRDYPMAESGKYLCESLYQLQKTAEEYGVHLLLQNVSSCISTITSDSGALRNLLTQIDKGIGISLSTCAVCSGGETLEVYFERFGNRIKVIQLADSDEEDEQLVLGEGSQDLKSHIETLSKYHFRGPVALEITMEEYAYQAEQYYAESLQKLKSLCQEV